MPDTAELRRLDLAHLWHPFTQMKLWPEEPPLIIDRAEGAWLIDTDGNRYFDGVSSLWVTVHGHNVPEINQAIIRQLGTLDHSTLLGLSHPQAIRLAAELARLTPPGLNKIFYSESGSTAVEIALKMVYQYWQHLGHKEKKTFVALENGYHGDTIGAVSVGGIDIFHQAFKPFLFPVHRLPQPHCRHCRLLLTYPACDLACARKLEDILQQHGHEICALIVEPKVQGAAGMIIQPEGYLSKLVAICRKYGVLVIADEVATGFGRTGPMFACELEDVRPDLMALGKGLTGGVLPLAATLTGDHVYQPFLGEFDEFKTFFHGHTYTGNPITSAAALANLELMAQRNILENVRVREAQLAAGLARLAELPHVVEIRHQGMMAGIELAKDAGRDEPYDPSLRMGHRVIMACRQHGVIIRPLGDTIVLMPPLSSTAEEIDHLLKAVEAGISEVTG
ncbi:MAG: adenosylmethionine--8-amino-7-oxononanoate transaminase [Deltaproteobacteria bacterium]|nr:adenosylmethionine--8-amino-7-oxononanoate transaminase [Deltaproteobacteria bacterium]